MQMSTGESEIEIFINKNHKEINVQWYVYTDDNTSKYGFKVSNNEELIEKILLQLKDILEDLKDE